MITFDRNPRSRSTGLGDHLAPESVITIDRNTQAGSEGPTLISCTASHLLSSVRSWHTVVCLSHDQAGGEVLASVGAHVGLAYAKLGADAGGNGKSPTGHKKLRNSRTASGRSHWSISCLKT